jgi:hypothetical protein
MRPVFKPMAPLFAGAALTFAQPADAADETGVTDLTPEQVEGLPSGKMSIVEGTTGPEGDKFNVPALSLMQPTSVTLVADRQGDDVRMKLGKFAWDEDFGGGGTGSTGYRVERFRTQGDLLITVNAAKADTPYRLIVWTGDEQDAAALPAVLVPPSQADGGCLPKWLLYVAGGLLALGGAFYLGRRRAKA